MKAVYILCALLVIGTLVGTQIEIGDSEDNKAPFESISGYVSMDGGNPQLPPPDPCEDGMPGC